MVDWPIGVGGELAELAWTLFCLVAELIAPVSPIAWAPSPCGTAGVLVISNPGGATGTISFGSWPTVRAFQTILPVGRLSALNGELGLTVAPGGDIVTVNSGDGNLVEVTPGGAQVVTKNIDPAGAGAGDLFGLAVKPGADAVYFVNDGTNTLNLLH